MGQQDRWTEGDDRRFAAEERRFRQGPEDRRPGQDWAYGDAERAYAAGYGIDESPYGHRWGRGPRGSGQSYGGQGYGGQGYGGPSGEDRTWMERAGERLASWFGGPGEGAHRGRGPRNYVRTDARITEDINEALTDDPVVDASDVQVAVANGEATLSGQTASREERRRAEDIAARVLGVRHVQNDIRVEGRSGGDRGDEPLPVPMV